jgi:hypothetical protein
MVGSRISGRYSTCIFGLSPLCAFALVFAASASGRHTQGQTQQQPTQQTAQTSAPNEVPRGKKLILKDGS